MAEELEREKVNGHCSDCTCRHRKSATEKYVEETGLPGTSVACSLSSHSRARFRFSMSLPSEAAASAIGDADFHSAPESSSSSASASAFAPSASAAFSSSPVASSASAADEHPDDFAPVDGILGSGKVEVSVSDPTKVGEGMGAYTVFRVTTKVRPVFSLGHFRLGSAFALMPRYQVPSVPRSSRAPLEFSPSIAATLTLSGCIIS